MTVRSSDVAIVGYGPTGMVLAALLGCQGYTVTVLERYSGLYNLPRAACFDDEIMRLFQKLGLVEEVMPGVVAQPDYEWVNARGETLVHLSYDDPAPGGWAALYMMYQPHIETVLDARCRSLETVTLLQGVTVDAIVAEPERVRVGGRGQDGSEVSVDAAYVVGADGGRSFVRGALGVGSTDYGFQENWLVCDFEKRGELTQVPSFRQVCDPVQPTSIVRIGPRHHRFSFMLEPDEDRVRATDPANVWHRVATYLGREDAELVRVANYVFRSRLATRWRSGRVLLAGDAAHEMPPFLAQGMCSGMRDAHNLAWKLDLVLGHGASDRLLDSYQPEREPHVRFITEKAIELGRVQTLRDPDAARARDERLLADRRASRAPEKLRYPALSGGWLADGDLAAAAGEFFPQGRVRTPAGVDRFDDVAAPGLCLLLRGEDDLRDVPPETLERWRSLGGTVRALGAELQDLDGVYAAWFAAHDCRAVVVRPDWYVYGTVPAADRSNGAPDGTARILADVLASLGTRDGRPAASSALP